jgi:hypothetical protein
MSVWLWVLLAWPVVAILAAVAIGKVMHGAARLSGEREVIDLGDHDPERPQVVQLPAEEVKKNVPAPKHE